MNSEMKRRLAMTVAGVLIAGFSVGMFQYSAMGLDPFQVFAHGVWKRINGPSFGFVYMVLNMILLAVASFSWTEKRSASPPLSTFSFWAMWWTSQPGSGRVCCQILLS